MCTVFELKMPHHLVIDWHCKMSEYSCRQNTLILNIHFVVRTMAIRCPVWGVTKYRTARIARKYMLGF